ncbi:hypothetical protein TUM12370_09370 [Salmonella enterica subsp. enterica serovar Choleraesuis]|nr:hypothetical protein TUM12370_09370 [Salmonella enterica subsp. enterica serovar Choleraesuis]
MDILNVIFKPLNRQIGTMFPDVVLSEIHTDTMKIAAHPVEWGADVSDHAWAEASTLKMECAFSGNWQPIDFSSDDGFRLLPLTGPADVYQELLSMQRQAVPFQVITGKRTYQNMLITSLTVTTDKPRENILSCSISLQEVIFAETHALAVANKQMMKQGNSTSGVENGGVRSTVARNYSSGLIGGSQ